MKTMVDLLKKRIERNYEDFREKTLMLDDESIYESARRIAAVEDVHFYITTHEWVDENEAQILLGLENPLEAIADYWEECLDDQNTAFGTAIKHFINEDSDCLADWDEDEDGGDDFSAAEALDMLDELEEQIEDLREEFTRLTDRGLDI